MRATYRVLAHLIAGMVVIQAAAIAMWVFGLLHWLTDGDGNTVTSQLADDRLEGVTGAAGITIHSFGAIVVALLAIILLIVSFFAKIPGGVKWAGFVFLAVLLQWIIAIVSFETPALGFLHGANALVVLGVSLRAGKQASVVETAPASEAAVAR
ncbi:MAG: hypothetical protein ABWX73_10735 [Marmoricola sp.]